METTPQGITVERSGRAVAVHWRVESAVRLVASAPVAAWVAPTSAASSGVAVVPEAEGVVLESLDVWQLGTPEITTRDM